MDEQLGEVAGYGRKVSEFLEGLGAEVEAFKFLVEKEDDVLTFDFAVKATFHSKDRADLS